MRIVIDPGAANDADAHRWLDRILYRIEDGWHVWDLSESDPDALQTTAWIRDRGAQGDRVRELLVASIRRGAWNLGPHCRRVRVTPRPTGPDELAPEQAHLLADERLVILVENRFSDGAFVKRVVKELDMPLHKLWGRGTEPIRFDSAGGAGQMRRVVEARTNGATYRPRLVAVIDSDRKGPGDTESDAARDLRRACEDGGLSCWVLAKREAENYLPRILLGAKPNAGDKHDRLLEAWDRLSDDQKDFFDVKRGLPDDPSPMSPIERELFDGLPDADREILAEGFGNVDECWNQWQVRGVKDDLLTRGRCDIERGVELIRKEL